MWRGGGGAYGNAAITGGNTWFVPTGGASGVASASTNVITEESLASIALPALNGGSAVRIQFHVSCTNNVNAKTMRVRYGGAAGTILIATSVASGTGFGFWMTLQNRGATNSQYLNIGADAFHPLGSSGPGQTFSIDTSAAASLVISSQKGTGTDSLSLESYLIEVLKP